MCFIVFSLYLSCELPDNNCIQIVQNGFLMSHKAPYVSDEYKHLLSYSQGQPNTHHGHNQNAYFQPQQPNQYVFNNQLQPSQYFIQQQQIHQQPIVFLPSAPQNNVDPKPRISDDSYAADGPDLMYPSINSYEKPSYGNHSNNNQPPQYSQPNYLPTTPTTEPPKQVIHKIEYGDTLQGLALIYDTSIHRIKQRNNIEGDSIYYLKQVIIPNPRAQPLQSAKSQQMLIEQFMGYMSADQRSDKTARFYLNDNDWSMEEAVKAFKEDLDWERKNRVKIATVPVGKYGTGVKANYHQQELLIKKRA